MKMNQISNCYPAKCFAFVLGVLLTGSNCVLAGFNVKADLERTHYQGNGRQIVKVKLKRYGSANVYADMLDWEITKSTDSTKSVPGTVFSSFCLDLTQPARDNTRFRVEDVSSQHLSDGISFLSGHQLVAIGSLFHQFFARVSDGRTAAAFQLAVWEIVYDTSGQSSSYDLSKGNFRAKGEIGQISNEWLSSLTNDGIPLRIFATNNGQSQVSSMRGGLSAVPEPFSVIIWSALGCTAFFAGRHRRRVSESIA